MPPTDFLKTRELFHLPQGIIYLDGNSLGPLPKAAEARVAQTMEAEWGELLIKAWNEAGWMDQPRRIGDRIGRLIGAPPGSVTMGDTLSIKVYQALAAALEMNPGRRIILSDRGNFPSDLYMAEGLITSLDKGHRLKLVEPEGVEDAIDDQVAVLMLTEVDYRTGRLHDMVALSQKAQAHGVITLWDLAHSAGALPVDLTVAKADLAVGCTYKYLNGGPGAPAFIYVAPRWADEVRPALSGWLGHAAPFSFDLNYRPGPGVERLRVGTPSIIAFSALEAALDIWEVVEMTDLRNRSIELSELFIRLVEQHCPKLILASPRDSARRGSQVSFCHENGYAVMQALIDRGVIGDFRAPDMMRFGVTPLYVGPEDIEMAVEILRQIMVDDVWDRPEYLTKKAVT